MMMRKITIAVWLIFLCVQHVLAQENPAWDERMILEQNIAHDPTSPVTRNWLGDYYLMQNDEAAALKEFQTAVSLHPNDSYAHFRLGTIYQHRDQTENAIREYRAALDWAGYPIQIRMAESYLALGEPKISIAILESLRGISDGAELHYLRAMSFARLSRYRAALSEIEIAKPLDPDFEIGRRFLNDRAALLDLTSQWERQARDRASKIAMGIILLFGVPLLGWICVKFKNIEILKFGQVEEEF